MYCVENWLFFLELTLPFTGLPKFIEQSHYVLGMFYFIFYVGRSTLNINMKLCNSERTLAFNCILLFKIFFYALESTQCEWNTHYSKQVGDRGQLVSQVFPSNVRILEIKFRLSGMVASPLPSESSHQPHTWQILLPNYSNLEQYQPLTIKMCLKRWNVQYLSNRKQYFPTWELNDK